MPRCRLGNPWDRLRPCTRIKGPGRPLGCFRGLGFRAWDLGFGVFRSRGLGFRVRGLGAQGLCLGSAFIDETT